jgi:hypothetical protein
MVILALGLQFSLPQAVYRRPANEAIATAVESFAENLHAYSADVLGRTRY